MDIQKLRVEVLAAINGPGKNFKSCGDAAIAAIEIAHAFSIDDPREAIKAFGLEPEPPKPESSEGAGSKQ